MAIETGSTAKAVSNYNQAHVDRMLHDTLLEIGVRDTLFEKFAVKQEMSQGMGNIMSWLRYNRLDIPTTTLTEGVPPTHSSLGLSRTSVTLSQWGQTVALSDLLQWETNHDVLKVAIEQLGESMAMLRDGLYIETLSGGTNSVFSGSSNTTRSGIAAGDVLDTEDMLRALNVLETTDGGTSGRAPRDGEGCYTMVCHPRVALDLQADSVWINTQIRQDKGRLEGTPFDYFKWNGLKVFTSNNIPQIENAEGIADGNDTRDDGTATAKAATGGSLSDDTYYVQVVARKKKNWHAQFVYDETSATTDETTAVQAVTDVMPSDTDYVYDVYIGTVSGTLYLSSRGNAAGATVTTGSVPTSGVAVPAQPASGVIVYPSFVFAPNAAYGGVDMAGSKLTAGLAGVGRTFTDPLDQLTKAGYKFNFGSLILNDNFLVRIESTSAYGSSIFT